MLGPPARALPARPLHGADSFLHDRDVPPDAVQLQHAHQDHVLAAALPHVSARLPSGLLGLPVCVLVALMLPLDVAKLRFVIWCLFVVVPCAAFAVFPASGCSWLQTSSASNRGRCSQFAACPHDSIVSERAFD